MPQTRLTSTAILTSYVKRIRQELMDKIIDFIDFSGIRNQESFMQSVHVLIILPYIGLRKLLQATLCRFHILDKIV